MRYIEMNPVRAGMVEHPAQYRWSSYAANARGIDNAIIQPHELYLLLGKTPETRQAAYRGLFAIALNPDELDLIRGSLHSGTPLGNERFKKQIESVVGGTVGFSQHGRPLSPTRNGVCTPVTNVGPSRYVETMWMGDTSCRDSEQRGEKP